MDTDPSVAVLSLTNCQLNSTNSTDSTQPTRLNRLNPANSTQQP